MNKRVILKPMIILMLMVMMAATFVSAASAAYLTDTKTATGRSGTWIGYGVGADKNGNTYTNVSFHSGANAGTATFVSLYHSFSASGSPVLSDIGTTTYQPYDLGPKSGPYSGGSVTAYASANFRDSTGTFTVSGSGTATI